VKDGSRDTTRDRVILKSDLKPPEEFKPFMRVNIKTGDIIRKRSGLSSEDIDNHKWSG